MNRKLSLVGASIFFDPKLFEWIGRIEDHAEEIRAEFDELARRGAEIPTMAELGGGAKSTAQENAWRAVCLYTYGRRTSEDRAFLPRCYACLEKIPDIKTAFLSILQPRTRIPEHRGPYNGVLRYHLGISIPEGDCGIVVGGVERRWRNGESLVFDDAYRHYAWNDTDETRVVLFVDFLRPLPAWYSWINRIVYDSQVRTEFRRTFLSNAMTSASAMAKTEE